MNHKISYLLSLCAFGTTFVCTAMKNDNNNILATLTMVKEPRLIQYLTNHHIIAGVKEPHLAQYLTDDRMVIAGKNQCNIIDPLTNTIVKELNWVDCTPNWVDCTPNHLTIHPNKKKIALCTRLMNDKNNHKYNAEDQYYGEIRIYNTETGELEWLKKHNSPAICAFDPFDEEIIFISDNYFPSKIVKYDYVKDKQEATHNDKVAFSLHPTQQLICTANRSEISIRKSKDFELADVFSMPKDDAAISCEYSPDGSRVAVYYEDSKYYMPGGVFITRPDLNPNQYVNIDIPKKIEKFAFYSDKILATLSGGRDYEQISSIDYWNIETQQLICTTQLNSGFFCKDFSFSPDGRQLLVTLCDKNTTKDGKCIMIPVPAILQSLLAKCTHVTYSRL